MATLVAQSSEPTFEIFSGAFSVGQTYRTIGDEISDANLMRRFRNGDAEAFRALYLRHRSGLYRYVVRLIANPSETDEIFQDVWLAVIHNRVRYQPTAKFTTYLFSIAHRRVIDLLRRQGRTYQEFPYAEEEIARMADEAALQPHEMAQLSERREIMTTAIAKLPIAQREAFLMQVEAGMSLEEIADATQVGRETVKSRLRYAYARLRSELGTVNEH